jgi:hypothetical protein
MKDVPTPESLRPGSIVGPWRIEGYAGRGSYGLVFRARLAGYPHSPLVALKVAVFAYDPRFVREAALLSRLHHPSIPRLLGQGWWVAGPEAAHPYVVMEWIRGMPLYVWAREHQATPRQVLRVLAQVAGALAVLHQADSLHRDVKGDNILVDSEGRAVLMDYGSSTWAGAPPLTESLMPPNTREYRSPEAQRFEWGHWRTKGARYQGRPADDLHALGVSMYRLVTRQYPPPGTEPEELKERREAPSPRRLPAHEYNERVVPELSALIERLLANDPQARGSAHEVEEAAGAVAEHVGPQADVAMFLPEPVRVRDEPREHAGVWRRGLAAAALVLTVAGAWWLGHESREPRRVMSDAATTALGDAGVPTPNAAQEEPHSAKTVSLPMPKEPLPGQRRAPCGRGEVEIRGGCWVPWTALSPPCGEKAYEWKGACYLPFGGSARVPTTQKPQ